MTEHFFPIDRIRLFSGDGQVYRAFGHLVAARVGSLLCVPFHLAVGRCDGVLDGCPAPWEEVDALLNDPLAADLSHGLEHVVEVMELAQQLTYLGLDPLACELDFVDLLGGHKAVRLAHPCGVRYGVVMD